MMKCAVIALLLLASNASAQVPRIDSMFVDEWHHELQLYGNFGAVQGTVRCDSIALPVVSWSDSLVRATIPDTERGSCGAVVVGAGGFESAARVLSRISGSWGVAIASVKTTDGNNWQVSGNYTFLFAMRFDLKSLNNSDREVVPIVSRRLTQLDVYFAGYTHTGHGSDGTEWVNDPGYPSANVLPVISDDSVTKSGFHLSCSLQRKQRRLVLLISDISGVGLWYRVYYNNSTTVSEKYVAALPNFALYIPLDSDFSVKSSLNGYDSLYGATVNVLGRGYLFRPDTLLSLSSKPTLISPANDSVVVTSAPVTLRWRSLQYMSGYVMQYATDSTLLDAAPLKSVLDTAISVSDFSFNQAYYWRVAGTNSEGQAGWSSIWRLEIVDPALVEDLRTGTRSFTCTPNPATNILNITLPAPARVVLYDLRGNIVRSVATSEPTLRIETGYLASGTYIISVFTNGKRSSTTVSIVH